MVLLQVKNSVDFEIVEGDEEPQAANVIKG